MKEFKKNAPWGEIKFEQDPNFHGNHFQKTFLKFFRHCCRKKILTYVGEFASIATIKAELPQEGILFRTQFPSLGTFINKKVGFRKN